MRVKGWIVLLTLLALASGCARPRTTGPAPVGDIADQLMAADRAFAVAAAARGLEGWMSFMASDAVRLGRMANPVRGTDAIRKADAGTFADPALRLEWTPTDAGVFDRHLGWTVGRYEIVRRGGGGSASVLGRGRYITIWRRAADGRWLVVLDTGAPDPPPPPAR